MALAFGNTQGKAQSNKADSYTIKDGENKLRLVGGVLARYIYWVKGSNDKDIPLECLAFDREEEKFNNKQVDHVQKYFPDKKCSWAYSINCIDPTDGKVKAFNLKKKLFEQILTAADDLGDPTDVETGWDIVWKRTKTGPLAFNVEHTLSVLKCKKRALTPEERQAVDEAKTIDEAYPRATPDEIKTMCERLINGDSEEETSNAGSDVTPDGVNDI